MLPAQLCLMNGALAYSDFRRGRYCKIDDFGKFRLKNDNTRGSGKSCVLIECGIFCLIAKISSAKICYAVTLFVKNKIEYVIDKRCRSTPQR